MTRTVTEGFTRGSVLLEPISVPSSAPKTSLFIEFENENLSAVLKEQGKEDKMLAVCPDLITVLDKANGAPLGISDYKYGLRVSVIALRSPPVWTTERGLEMGGPRAFGYVSWPSLLLVDADICDRLDVDYKSVGVGGYTPPKSVWEMFGESS